MNTNKDKAMGQLRAALTATGSALATWGVTDGNEWAPVVGVILALVSVLWGVAFYRKKDEKMTVRYSLIRKLVNAVGVALITYEVTSPEQIDKILVLVGALGPIIASSFSWVVNSEGDTTGGTGKYLPGLLLVAGALVTLFPSCGLRMTPDGCVLGVYERDGTKYLAGPCFGEDMDGDGDNDINRYRVRWETEDGLAARATYWVGPGARPVVVEYLVSPGLWVGWSSKSGVVIGPLPPLVQSAIDGDPEPAPVPSPSL